MSADFPLDELTRAVVQAARARDGRLVRVLLAGAGEHDGMEQALSARLARSGLPGVEVAWQGSSGSTRVVALEFLR